MMKSAVSHFLAATALIVATVPVASASVTVTFAQVGDDVVATTSGSFNSFAGVQTSAPSVVNMNGIDYVNPAGGAIQMGGENGYQPYRYRFQSYTPAGSFGSGLTTQASSRTTTPGADFLFTNNAFFVSAGYTLGTSIASTAIWYGHTISTLGMTPGVYTWSWTGDSFTLIVPVPEPSTYGLALGGLALVGAVMRRRKSSK